MTRQNLKRLGEKRPRLARTFPTERQRNADFERGTKHGIAIAMLSAGLSELRVEGREHILWSYTHQLSSDLHDMHGTQTYRIKELPKSDPK